MKKLLVLILALTMVLAFTACRDDACESHVDDDNDGICDVCETEIPNADDHPDSDDENPNPEHEHTVHTDENKDGICDGCDSVFIDYAKPTVVGSILKKSLEKQFEEMKSLKVEFDAEYIYDDDYWYESIETEGDETVFVPVHDPEYKRAVLDFDVWLSKRGESFDVKATINVKTSYDKDDELEPIIDGETVYIIDGYVYTSIDEGYYSKAELIPESVKEKLAEIASIELFNDEEKNELLESLGAEIATVFNIADNKGSVSFDAKPAIDDLIEYVAALDVEKDTLRGVINDALALISPTLTVEAILTEASRFAGLTVTEALAELDAWLTENHETTVQGIYDSIVNDPELISALETLIINMNGIDVEDPEQKEMLDGMIADVKAFKLADTITEAGIADVPLYDLILSLIPAPSSEEEVTYLTKDEFFAMINDTLDMTLAEIEEAFDIYTFSGVKKSLSGFSVDQLNGKIDLNFTGILNLASIEGVFNLDVSNESESSVDDKTNKGRVAIFASFKVSEISTTASEIALPKDAIIVDERLLDGEFVNEEAELYLWSNTNYETGSYEVNFELYMYDEVSESEISISVYGLTVEDMLADEITAKNFSVAVNNLNYPVDEDAVVKIAIDLENDTFSVKSIPELKIPSVLETALRDICNNYIAHNLDSRIKSIMSYGEEYIIVFQDGVGYETITFAYTYNEDENVLDCTVTGFSVDSAHSVYNLDSDTAWYGGIDDLDKINAYLGANTTFKIYIDIETDTFTYDAIPEILEKYRKEW